MAKNILIFMEDPGAANYVIGLTPILKSYSIDSHLLVQGAALKFLQQRGEDPESIDNRVSPDLLIEEGGYDAVLVGTSENPRTIAFDLISTARKRGILSIGIVDACMNSQNRFKGLSQNPLKYAPDVLFVPDDKTKSNFEELGFPSACISVIGNPAIDAAIIKADELKKEPYKESRSAIFGKCYSERKILVFISELSDGLNPDDFRKSPDYVLTGRGQNDSRTLIVLEEVLDALALMSPRPELIVRLHPKEDIADFSDYQDEVMSFSQDDDPLRGTYFSDGVVGMSSTLLLEVAAMGVPAISVVPREIERCWVPQSKSINIPVVTKRENISIALQSLLVTGKKQANHYVGKMSSDLIAEAIVKL
jgi:hypothetical protein